MKRPTLYRATFDIQDVTGRTLSGHAIPWNLATEVRDYDRATGTFGDPYLEAFAETSTDVTLSHHLEPFPLFSWHDYKDDDQAERVGGVVFIRAEDGLDFEAVMTPGSAKADDTLAKVKDGSWESTSVGFTPIHHVDRQTPGGTVRLRTEVALGELSLAPTGMGQYPEAKVLAIRAKDGTPGIDFLKARRSRNN